LNYLEFEPRTERTETYVHQLIDHFKDTRAGDIDQEVADRAVAAILEPDAKASTKRRIVYGPLTAVLRHGAARKWCPMPSFQLPSVPKSATPWLSPFQAEDLIAGAAPHLKPLLQFLLSVGPRLSEALDLDWADLDLAAARVVFRDAKNGKDRVACLPSAIVVELARLPLREGKVFRRDDGEPYVDRERLEGGQIKRAFGTACRRAGFMKPMLDKAGNPRLDAKGRLRLKPSISPHVLRHSWATWFYALTKDPLLLKTEGDWHSITMVERYAHLMPSTHVGDIWRVWGTSHPRIGALPTRAPAVHTGEMVGNSP
jgi:integrase